MLDRDSRSHKDAMKEIIKLVDMCYELSAQLARFNAVNSGTSQTKEDPSLPLLKVMELHAKLALKLDDQCLISVIKV